MNNDIKLVNDRVKEVRNYFNLTQKDFAKSLKVGRSTIASIENYTNKPSNQLLYNICKEYGIKEEWIKQGEGSMIEPIEVIIKNAIQHRNHEEIIEGLANVLEELTSNDKILDFDKDKDKPKFYKILDFLKKEYEEAEQDMKGYLTIKLQKDFPEYEEHVKKNQPEQKDA